MSERDTLLNWLDRAAARSRHADWLRGGVALLSALLALVALHQVLRATIPVPEVLTALLPFLVFAAAGAVAVVGGRLWRRPTREQAAMVADARAQLRDELRSALWFAQHGETGPMAGLLVADAGRRAAALDQRRLFPLAIPRALMAALALAALGLGSAWLLPSASRPAAARGSSQPTALTVGPRMGAQAREPAPVARNGADQHAEADRARAAWARIEDLASALAGDGTDEIARAIAAHDAPRATQLVQALQQQQTTEAAGAAARPQTEQMSATLAAGILERLKDLLRAEAAQPEALAGNADAPTAQLTEQLRADTPPENGDPRGQQSAGENILNDMLRAINRSSIGQREVAGGGGDAAQQGGQSNVGGGAMGRRVGVSQAGGQGGDRPPDNPAGDIDSDPVLGQKTMRLEAQLQKVKVDSGASDEPPAGEESLYAQTRAQAARLGYEAVSVQARRSSEGLTAGEETPLAYRDAVKHYMLEQHAKDASRPQARD